MKKNSLLLLLAATLLSGSTYAQHVCATNEMHEKYKQGHPEIEEQDRLLNERIRKAVSGMHLDPSMRTTTAGGDTTWHIPVVVHIVHNYGNEFMNDNDIYNMIANMNKVYNAQNDTSSVIRPFKKHVGKTNIKFHLATKDPQGNPTKGITRRLSYLTYGGDDNAKLDQWPPTSYFNIWFENVIGRAVSAGTILAYATFPASAAAYPFNDGVICGYLYINSDNTIEHEAGHYLNLQHTWNSSGQAAGTGGACGDDDVDDTPPTIGHFSTCQLYDTLCATNYFKVYTSISGTDSLVNYPDTVNTQNIMDYSSCTNMFTRGQSDRMRAALNDDLGGRNNLKSAANLALTGALDPLPDLPPVPDFYPTVPYYSSVPSSLAKFSYFTTPYTQVRFQNRTWGDTVTNVSWTFTNGATVPTATMTNPNYTAASSAVFNKFSEPGWVNVTMTATGNNSGSATKTFEKAIFVADATATPAEGYYQDFIPGTDVDKWVTFNYYNNTFKWEHANVGYLDNHCMKYSGYDHRVIPSFGIYPPTGTPLGDYDDMFSVPVDLSTFGTGACNLNFFTSGASRGTIALDVNDTLIVSYSADSAKTWNTLVTYTKGNLINKGSLSIPYAPLWAGDWLGRSINIPNNARKPYTLFRFRYRPGVDHRGFNISTGNNFYLDRISFSKYTTDIAEAQTNELDVVVAPNPTGNNAHVLVKDADNTNAAITVTDITGKVVYTISKPIVNGEAYIEIPQSALSVKGIYMVQAITGNQTKTQKLVVY